MIAFAVPIVPGKEGDFEALIADLTGSRSEDWDALNSRYGLTQHSVWLQPTPDGHQLVVVVQDGPGAGEFLAKLAASEDAEDAWFREMISNIHGLDFSGPIPPVPEHRI